MDHVVQQDVKRLKDALMAQDAIGLVLIGTARESGVLVEVPSTSDVIQVGQALWQSREVLAGPVIADTWGESNLDVVVTTSLHARRELVSRVLENNAGYRLLWAAQGSTLPDPGQFTLWVQALLKALSEDESASLFNVAPYWFTSAILESMGVRDVSDLESPSVQDTLVRRLVRVQTGLMAWAPTLLAVSGMWVGTAPVQVDVAYSTLFLASRWTEEGVLGEYMLDLPPDVLVIEEGRVVGVRPEVDEGWRLLELWGTLADAAEEGVLIARVAVEASVWQILVSPGRWSQRTLEAETAVHVAAISG